MGFYIDTAYRGTRKEKKDFLFCVLFWTLLDGMIVALKQGVKKQHPHHCAIISLRNNRAAYLYTHTEQPYYYAYYLAQITKKPGAQTDTAARQSERTRASAAYIIQHSSP